jgi:RiboL-PSP-HEPN
VRAPALNPALRPSGYARRPSLYSRLSMPFRAYDAATDLIKRARNQLEMSSSLHLAKSPRLKPNVRGDMRRLSIVMAVAALDTYMHRLVVERAYEHDELPGGLAALGVRFDQLLALADQSAAGARKKPHNARPRVGVKKQLRDRLLRETFQNYEEVSRALGMAGQSKKWELIGARLDPPLTPAEIKETLNAIVGRRNQIVHEGDYERRERPRSAKLNGITYKQAKDKIDFLADLIDAIHDVVSGRVRVRGATASATATGVVPLVSAAPAGVEPVTTLSVEKGEDEAAS